MSLLNKTLLNKFKEDIEKMANQDNLEHVYTHDEILTNINKLEARNFIWGDKEPIYTEEEKLTILKTLTEQQKTFIATAVSRGDKNMAGFGFRGVKMRGDKPCYASGSIGVIKLELKNEGLGVNIKVGLRFQKVPSFVPLLASIKSEYKMEGGPIAEKLKNDNIKLYVKILDDKITWLEKQEWFKTLLFKDKEKYINQNIIKQLDMKFSDSKR